MYIEGEWRLGPLKMGEKNNSSIAVPTWTERSLERKPGQENVVCCWKGTRGKTRKEVVHSIHGSHRGCFALSKVVSMPFQPMKL